VFRVFGYEFWIFYRDGFSQTDGAGVDGDGRPRVRSKGGAGQYFVGELGAGAEEGEGEVRGLSAEG
jgi:hypothetical protein